MQMKVKGTINGADYESNVMPAGSGRLTLSVSQKMMMAAGVGIDDLTKFEIEKRDEPLSCLADVGDQGYGKQQQRPSCDGEYGNPFVQDQDPADHADNWGKIQLNGEP
jgi:hypothetical protein